MHPLVPGTVLETGRPVVSTSARVYAFTEKSLKACLVLMPATPSQNGPQQ